MTQPVAGVDGEEAPLPRRRNAKGQGQVLRAQLLEAATALLADLDSPQSLTLRMVAREVGVAPASIYGHFADLSDLVEAVLAERYADLSAAVQAAAEDASSPLEVLAARCWAYVQWGLAHPGHYRVVFGGRTPPGVAHHPAAGPRMLEDLTAALAQVRTSPSPTERSLPGGLPVADDEQRHRAGLLLWTALHGVVSLRIDKPGTAWPPVQDMVVDLLLLHAGAALTTPGGSAGRRGIAAIVARRTTQP